MPPKRQRILPVIQMDGLVNSPTDGVLALGQDGNLYKWDTSDGGWVFYGIPMAPEQRSKLAVNMEPWEWSKDAED